MKDGLVKMISKDDISNNLTVFSRGFSDMPEVRYYTFSYNKEMTGYASISVDDKNERIHNILFFPFEDTPELRGNGIGPAAYFLLLEEIINKKHAGPPYDIEQKIKKMTSSSRKMWSKMSIVDNFEKYSKDAIFIIPVIPLKDRVEKFLKNNGYDVEALVQNGINSNVS